MEWVNWSGSQRCTPARHAQPRTRGELVQAIADGIAPVRVAGAGHSFSAGALTEGTLISLDHLTRVLDADAATGLVRVEAGIRLHQLSRELHTRGLAMPNLGDIDAQSLAGALTTGTHGTGTRFPILAAQVESVELIAADGRELTLSGGDGLRAARVSLGALGVVAAVTIRCVPAFRLRIVDRPEPLEDVLDGLQERADAHNHFEFW
jgi:L-gulonolactone oxidase